MGTVSGVVLGVLSASFAYYLYEATKERYEKERAIEKDANLAALVSFKTPSKDAFSEELLQSEQLSRTRAALSPGILPVLLEETFVIIIGCGGVGSHAAHSLIRNGVGHVRLIDFDMVTLSSLNRAPMATRQDVGKRKVDVLAEQLRKIAPWATIEPIVGVFEAKVAAHYLQPNLIPRTAEEQKSRKNDFKYVFVMDCIDNVPTKIELLLHALELRRTQPNVYILSSMGAGAKLNPTRIRLSTLDKTCYDPLARAMRQQLKRRLKDRPRQGGEEELENKDGGQPRLAISAISVVYSDEAPNGLSIMAPGGSCRAAEREEDQDAAVTMAFSSAQPCPRDIENPYAILPHFRAGILPVLGPLPAIFGMTLGTAVLLKVRQLEQQDGLI
jgi:tRNA threonylcarbamoyladenosine dehydratase